MNALLTYTYTKEKTEDGTLVHIPTAAICFSYKSRLTQEVNAIVDSGSEITLVPHWIAKYLSLPYGKKIIMQGIHEKTDGHLSEANIIFFANQDTEVMIKVPVVIGDWSDIILGRKVIFDAFKITFTQALRLVEMERMQMLA